jgi:ketosteroid isomerase-like protein
VALLALAVSTMGAGCTQPDDGSSSASADQAIEATSPAVSTVRAYYASSRAADSTAALALLLDDTVVVEAPSILLITGKGEVGKAEFLKLAAGVKEYLAAATVREVIPHGNDLVVARIDLPLPNGDVLTQVEFFAVKNGKITHFQSYYDGIRFAKALPAVALDKIKRALLAR